MEHNIDNGHIYSNSLCRLSNLTTLDLQFEPNSKIKKIKIIVRKSASKPTAQNYDPKKVEEEKVSHSKGKMIMKIFSSFVTK